MKLRIAAQIVFLAATSLYCQAAGLAGKRPNILFLLTDDQGYGDVSCHGNPLLKTPNLDRLHAEGVRFEDFCVSPTCAPTRSALLTGRHEFKNGITHTILERERLTPTATTLAQVLQGSGYTTGIFGKWHLGDEPEYQPGRRGFDEVFIHGAGGIGQTYPGSCGDAPGNTYFDPAILHNGTFEKTRGYCTDVFFAQAAKWIEGAKDAGKPFYCHIATNAPHGPYIARPQDAALFKDKVPGDDAAANFYGMIHNIDENLGRLLAKLKEWGIEQNTLVIFINDNGGTAGVKHYNAGLRASKGSPWMGGIKASSFWRWPGTLHPATVTHLTAHIDFFPTLAALAGAKIEGKLTSQVEGRSLVPLLENPTAEWADRELFTHVGRWPKDADPQKYQFTNCSVRTARWQLVNAGGENAAKAKSKAPKRQGAPKAPKAAPGENIAKSGPQPLTPHWQLFDLQADPGQKTDVASAHPDVVKKLSTAYVAWWESVQPMLVNEKVPLAPENPFHSIYRKQFGTGK
ncbi:MAG: arylsulfatase [Verrucomicrobiaceae bacterium]|nr:arylsulfatase [Verrucomicrobiaceae bacterium]